MQGCVRLGDGECSGIYARRRAGSSARVCTRAVAAQHVSHGSFAHDSETFYPRGSHHGQHGATLTEL